MKTTETPTPSRRRSPIFWVPTAYFGMGLPFVVLNMVAVLMYKGLGVSDAKIAFWTSLIMLPWTLKPFGVRCWRCTVPRNSLLSSLRWCRELLSG